MQVLNAYTEGYTYFFGKNIPPNFPEGIDHDLEEKVIEGGEINDVKEYVSFLKNYYNQLPNKMKQSLSEYVGLNYMNINKQMRENKIEQDQVKRIKNIFKAMPTFRFGQTRLFRTEADNYQQEIEGQLKTSRELKAGDTWNFPSFISTTYTNQPNSPKIQPDGNLTVFVFEFEEKQPIRGVHINVLQNEAEYLLAPGVAKVKQVYERVTALGLIARKATFVICELDQANTYFNASNK